MNFSVPLYAGGAGSSRTRQALAERNAAKYNTLNVIRQNDLVINQLWAELESGKIVLEAQKANVDANIDAVEGITPVSYTHLRAHETRGNLVCRHLL